MEDERYPVIILAGGKSTRLGRDKASEVLAGKTLVQRAIDACESAASRLVIVTAKDQQLPEVSTRFPLTLVEDVFPETGPLGGICTGLEALSAPALPHQSTATSHALVVACDMPVLQPALLRALLALSPFHDAVAPVHDGLPEPLCATYSTKCVEPARHLLERGVYKVARLLQAVDTLLVPEEQWRPFDPEARSFLNVNREEDLERARRLIEGRDAP